MDYIRELRQLVGTRPVIMVGAAVLLLNQENQLLMIRRMDNNCWGIPGGAMELGENIEDTAMRETKEEIGIEVENLELFGVYSGSELYFKYPDGNEVYNVSIVYFAHTFQGKILLDAAEHSEYKFFDIGNLPQDISAPIKPILKDLVVNKKFCY
jgi:ADP-ribose pyrophosphatase YjhB (NUDIX family)